ncbi:MAG: peptidoglycan-binding domain-containing protein [Clostridia bacterium]|nr:peptidoglycan-binding domain-containing protein [Clostridia bacterium]
MASYYMDGYAPPQGVNSVSKVKEYQRQLGVKVDGIWGPDTDAAYRASIARQQATQNTGGFNWGDSGRNQTFDGYYNAIKNSLSVPTVTVKPPSKDEVSSMWSSILRPSADAAIEKRNRAAERDMAELDADAVSRGMGGSTYVTSVKAREMEEAQDDIGEIEAQYGAVLAERIYDTLSQYDQMSLSAQQYNASASAAAAETALSMASDWYSQYLAQQNAAMERQASGRSSGSSGGSSGSSKMSGLSTADYTEYVRNLTPAQQKLLFNSSTEYWSSRMDEIFSALGSALYENLKKQYGGN